MRLARVTGPAALNSRQQSRHYQFERASVKLKYGDHASLVLFGNCSCNKKYRSQIVSERTIPSTTFKPLQHDPPIVFKHGANL
jgi:hypothetical protein